MKGIFVKNRDVFLDVSILLEMFDALIDRRGGKMNFCREFFGRISGVLLQDP